MALPDVFTLAAASARASGISTASIADGANFLGEAIDNATNLDLAADLELVWSCASAPVADKVFKVYLLYALNGVNYEDGAGNGTGIGDVDPKAPVVGAAAVYADTASHRYLIRGVPLEPLPFKILVANETGQAATVSVNVKTYHEQVGE